MRMLAVAAVVLALSVETQARVWLTVYRHDGKTPLAPVDPNHPHVYGDIMVGTELVIVISSDVGLPWWGSLEYPEDDGATLSLTARGPAPEYVDSCLPAADDGAEMFAVFLPGRRGFEFLNGFSPTAGDWFILDYRAERVGSCELGVYDLDLDWDVPAEVLSFTHVPSCDFTGDNTVDFQDLALLALSVPPEADSVVSDQDTAVDPNSPRAVDFRDLARLSRHWLEHIAPPDPNQP